MAQAGSNGKAQAMRADPERLRRVFAEFRRAVCMDYQRQKWGACPMHPCRCIEEASDGR